MKWAQERCGSSSIYCRASSMHIPDRSKGHAPYKLRSLSMPNSSSGSSSHPACVWRGSRLTTTIYDIRIIAGSFIVRKQLVVLDLAKTYVARHLEGGVFAADRVQAARRSLMLPGASQSQRFDLVLLGIEILFLALDRRVDAQLERRPVDAVIRRKRRCHHCAHSECGPAAASAGARQECRACSARNSDGKTPPTSVCVSSVRYSSELLLCIAPRKIGVRLAETAFRQAVHDFRPRESFGQKYHIWVIRPDLCI